MMRLFMCSIVSHTIISSYHHTACTRSPISATIPTKHSNPENKSHPTPQHTRYTLTQLKHLTKPPMNDKHQQNKKKVKIKARLHTKNAKCNKRKCFDHIGIVSAPVKENKKTRDFRSPSLSWVSCAPMIQVMVMVWMMS